MINTIFWRPQMEVGYPPLDEEHKTFLDVINKAQEIAVSKNLVLMDGIFEKCYDYAVNHFPHEEEVMEQISFPDLESHSMAHQLFIAHISELRQIFIASPNVQEQKKSALLTADFLYAWFLGHILSRDKLYKPYLVRLSNSAVQRKYYN